MLGRGRVRNSLAFEKGRGILTGEGKWDRRSMQQGKMESVGQ